MMLRLLLVAGVTVCVAGPSLAGPAIAIRYTEPARLNDPGFNEQRCFERAEAAITATGFENIEKTGQSRYGTMRDYTAAIRCVLDKQVIFIVVSGPSRQTADRGAAALFQNFEGPR